MLLGLCKGIEEKKGVGVRMTIYWLFVCQTPWCLLNLYNLI